MDLTQRKRNKMAVDALDNDFFGITATYTVFGGAGVTVPVVITEDADSEDSDRGESGSLRHSARIYVLQSEVALKPVYRSTFILTDGNGVSQTWSIIPDGVRENRSVGDFTSEWVCDCQRFERPIIS